MTAGSSPADIRLIAVSKNFPPAAIAEAYAAGQVAFGENYLQEAVGKIATLSDLRLEWHGASPDGQSFEPDRNVRPSNGVRQRDVDGALGEAVELAHGSASSVARAGAPRSGASFPEGPLLRPLEWQAAHGRQDGKQREGGLRLSAGVASPEGPLLLPLEWHFIGPIQSNKTKQIAEQFHWVHGVDRLKIAERLSSSRPASLPPLQICIQVNVSGEESKSGVRPDEVLALAIAVSPLTGIRLRGLMAIPEPTPDIRLQRARFRQIRELKDEILSRGIALDTLSMGMSDDLEAAIAEGATLVRVGRAIFGERPSHPG